MSVERVNQLWPSGLKSEVVTLVGKRGLTNFTLQAVREKIARDKGQPEADAARASEQDMIEENRVAATENLAQLRQYDDLLDAGQEAAQTVDLIIAESEAPVARVEFPPAAIQPIPAVVVCATHGSEFSDASGYCWLCG